LYLAGFRNRVTVLVQWAYAYLTWQRGVRIIANYAAHVPAGKEAVPAYPGAG
jgi:NADH dehydrogenase